MKLVISLVLLFLFAPYTRSDETAPFDQIMKRVQNLAPEIHEELQLLKESEPTVFADEIERLRGAIAERDRVAKFSKQGAEAYWQMYRIDFEAVWYSDEIAASKDPQKTGELKRELKKQIAKSFDQWAIYEKAKLEKVKKDLEAAEAELAQHLANKNGIVEEDTEALIQESRDYLQKK